jgi:hypothetical protein
MAKAVPARMEEMLRKTRHQVHIFGHFLANSFLFIILQGISFFRFFFHICIVIALAFSPLEKIADSLLNIRDIHVQSLISCP